MISNFFMTRQYDLAEKIIDLLEQKIEKECGDTLLEPYPRIEGEIYDVTFKLKNKTSFARVLGDVIKAKLRDDLYDQYKKLDESEKIKIQKTILDVYFLLARDLVTIEYREQKCGSKSYNDYEVDVLMILPGDFLNKDRVTSLLADTILAVCEQLNTPNYFQHSLN